MAPVKRLGMSIADLEALHSTLIQLITRAQSADGNSSVAR